MQMLFSDKQQFIDQYRETFRTEIGRDFEACGDADRYLMLAKLIASRARSVKNGCAKECAAEGEKKIYYFSMEFLIGRLLENYLINFGVRDLVAEGLADMGTSLGTVCAQERDPGIGNGGLGRLAACFMDSLASLGYAGHGNGIRYRYGLFRQTIAGGKQVELPDDWLTGGYPWEVKKPENAVVVHFGGDVVRHEEDGRFWFTWEGGDRVLAMPYDVPVVGYGGKTVNTLRLWSAEPCAEKFDMDAFNSGNYSAAVKYRSDVEAITYILYPNDNADPGKVLRLKQEYLFVAGGLATIIKTFKKEYGPAWDRFPDLIAIHTNDTHPALCGPELLRILIDEEGLDWDAAWGIVTRCISYTNHTVLPEALEKWPISMFRPLLPRVYMFIEEIDRRYRESFPRDRENWQELLKNTAVLWDGQVRMANLSVICGHSVNGVAELHTRILEKDTLKSFYALTPDKFSNKTNGVSHRRFLAEANPGLAALITGAIGDGWMANADELSGLARFEDDAAFLDRFAAVKLENKRRLADYVKETSGVSLDPDSVFDVQVKRFHAYKRQLLNVFKIMDLYNRLVSDRNFSMRPTSFVFAGKAAQGYEFAKDVIRLVNSVADVVNADPRVRGLIRVAFVADFSVSNAQLIYPAAEISEQISTAGKEASGTGNMKFMMNGAVTLGTLDGANVEIRRLVGDANMEIFGLRAEETEAFRKNGGYLAWDAYNADRARLGRVVDELVDGTFGRLSGDFRGVYDTLMQQNDEFFVLKDFRPYLGAWERLEEQYGDRRAFTRMALHNTAQSGYFSSDRTVTEYAKEIWHAARR